MGFLDRTIIFGHLYYMSWAWQAIKVSLVLLLPHDKDGSSREGYW